MPTHKKCNKGLMCTFIFGIYVGWILNMASIKIYGLILHICLPPILHSDLFSQIPQEPLKKENVASSIACLFTQLFFPRSNAEGRLQCLAVASYSGTQCVKCILIGFLPNTCSIGMFSIVGNIVGHKLSCIMWLFVFYVVGLVVKPYFIIYYSQHKSYILMCFFM